MLSTDECLANLPEAVRILQSQITRNIFDGEQDFSVFCLGNEITQLIYERDFDIAVSDIVSLGSYQELLQAIPSRSKDYLHSRVEEFFSIWIEPVKIEREKE